jgi:hypothetical protein
MKETLAPQRLQKRITMLMSLDEIKVQCNIAGQRDALLAAWPESAFLPLRSGVACGYNSEDQ